MDYDKAIRLNPNDASFYGNRGRAWLIKNNDDRAIMDYDEAIRLNPNDGSFYGGRGFAWHNKKEYDKAIRDFDEAIRLDPNNLLIRSQRLEADRLRRQR